MKTVITITGLLGKPNIISRRTAAAEAIVYGTDGKTTHRIQGFALGLLPQHLPVTVTGEAAEDGSILVQTLTLARPVDMDAYLAWVKAMGQYAEAMQEYEKALREYRSREDDEDDDEDEPKRPKLKYPDSYKILTSEYDKWLRKIAGSKKAAQGLWEDVDAMLLDPAISAWLDEDKSQTRSWTDAPYEVLAGACYPYPVPAYATVWRRPPQDFFAPDELLSADQRERKAAAEKSYTAQRALGDACSAYWRYSILSRVLAGITVSQASLEVLRGAGDDDCLSKARLTCQHRSGDVIGINAKAVLAGRICDGAYGTPQYRVFPVRPGQVLQTALNVSVGQVLAPKYAGDAGIDRLNEELRKRRNPGPTVRFGRRSYAAGDPVIFTRNDYGAGYMNGDMGKVLAVAEAEMVVDLFGKQIIVSKADAEDIRPAYCISVHKAQGSEADDITIVLPADARGMVSRNLLYTAITRAKRSVTVICEQTETEDTYMDAAAIQAPPQMTLLPLLLAGRLDCRIAGDDVLGEDRSYIERLQEQLWQGQGKAITTAYPAIIDVMMHALREDMKRVASD